MKCPECGTSQVLNLNPKYGHTTYGCGYSRGQKNDSKGIRTPCEGQPEVQKKEPEKMTFLQWLFCD